MRVRKPGKVRDGLWYLGREESGVYLLEGRNDAMILNGGMNYILPDMMEQLQTFGINRQKISKLLILHAHFDHVGIVPYLKRSNPHMEVYASARGWEILEMPKAISTINEFSRYVCKRMGKEDVWSTYDLEWRDDVRGKILREGDRINVGGIDVRILEVPGHSSCSMAAYVPEMKALFPSDAGGIPFRDTIIPSGNSNYTKYQENLERLEGLDVEFYCADHYGYVIGEEARTFLAETIERARDLRSLIEETYRRNGDINSTSRRLLSVFYSENRDYFLDPDIFFEVYRQMVRHIAGAMESRA